MLDRIAVLLLVGHVSVASAPCPAQADAKPNIILVFVDDMGFGDLSCFGNPDVKTTHIDRLARDGIRLTQFYTNSPICSPSRVAVTTGQYPGRHRIHSFLSSRKVNRTRRTRDWLDPEVPCIARTFQEAGYATAHFGKWHMGGGRDVGDAPLPKAYGFDESLVAFEGLGDRVLRPGKNKTSERLGRGVITFAEKYAKTSIYVDRTIDFIKRSKAKRKPFYAHLWLNDVHTAYLPSKKQMERVAALDVHPFLKKMYAVMLDMDVQVGRLVQAIDDLGLGENTLIVLTSDNGPNLPRQQKGQKKGQPKPASRTGPYRGEKWSLYEGGIRMPFIARWKGTIPAGCTISDSVVSSVDFFPTFCALADVKPPAIEFDGEDMSDVLLGEPQERMGRTIFWEYGRQDIGFLRPRTKDNVSPNLAMRAGQWKLLANEDGSRTELYDFAASTNERKNVAAEHPLVVLELKKGLLGWYRGLPSVRDAAARRSSNSQPNSRPNRRPNIVLIMADDLGYECVSSNGSKMYETPHIDALAASGMRFRHAHAQPICTPSRVQIMSGIYNNRNYVKFGLLDPQVTTFADILKGAGYATCVAGKWQLKGDYAGVRKFGFDRHCLWQLNRRPSRYPNPGLEIDGERKDFKNGEFGPDVVTDYICKFLEERKGKDDPFFVYYPMIAPHWPFVPTPGSEDWDPKMWRDAKTEPGGYKSQEYWDGMVRHTDKMVGKVVRKLDELGLRDNTLVIFTGDNGTFTGVTSKFEGRDYKGGKGTTKDAGTHVPFMASWPGKIEKGQVSDALVDFSDVLPTLAEIGGATVPASPEIDGRSLAPVFRGERGRQKDYIYCWYQRNGVRNKARQLVRTQRYKLYASGAFFDVQSDPLENSPIDAQSVPKSARSTYAMLQRAIARHVEVTADADPIVKARRRATNKKK